MTLPSPPLTTRLLGASAMALASVAPAYAAGPNFVSDVIIDGSLCVGFDCPVGLAFGFDTVVLRENNLRVFFDDTSNSASFPDQDWRITVNASSNGGAEYFRISDATASTNIFTLEATAPSNALYVDDGGRIGFGTGAPVVELHIKDGDTPTVRLEQDGTSGFTAQTWDVAGNETNFFIRDVTSGSTLPLRIRPGASTSSLDIAADSDVFMGLQATGTYAGDLVVGGSGTKLVDIVSTNASATQYRMITDSGNRRFVAMDNAQNVETQMVFGNSSIQLAGTSTAPANIWATIDATGITTQGPTCNPGPCDRTFDPEYFEVPSIEEHADFMWENSYLWAVGPTGPDQPFNVTTKTAGMLHELEVAHIYIEQLHKRIEALEAAIVK